MDFQFYLGIFYLIFTISFVIAGITGDRHNFTHMGVFISSILIPFVAIKSNMMSAMPSEFWIYYVFGILCQLTFTLFHKFYSSVVHSRGPEVVLQIVLTVWTVALRITLPGDIWSNGYFGIFLFCFQGMFIGLGTLMYIYISNGTSITGDNVDLIKYTKNSRSNAAFLTVGPVALFITLFAVFVNYYFLLGAVFIFVINRLTITMNEAEITKET